MENKEKKKSKKEISHNQIPVESLKKFWKLDPTDNEIISQVEEFQLHHNLDNEKLLSLLFQSLFDKNILYSFEQNSKIYSLFKNLEQFQSTTLFCIEQLCEKEESLLPSIVNNIIQPLLRKEVLTKEGIIYWQGNPRNEISVNISQQIRDLSKSLVAG